MNDFALGDKVYFWKEKEFLLFYYAVLAEGMIISKDNKLYVVKSGRKEYFVEKRFCFDSKKAGWSLIGLWRS